MAASARLLVDNVATVVKFGSLLHVLHDYVLEVTMCIGPSMMPTFNSSGDIVLLERLTTRLNRLERGDVVVARSPTNARQTVCKRVRALGGDRVRVNGPFGERAMNVPAGYVWLEGDNPSNSTDSRHYGPVPAALVMGRVFLKAWPPSEAGWVKRM
eukprot:g5152.t1